MGFAIVEQSELYRLDYPSALDTGLSSPPLYHIHPICQGGAVLKKDLSMCGIFFAANQQNPPLGCDSIFACREI
jgi:hypothetical protein